MGKKKAKKRKPVVVGLEALGPFELKTREEVLDYLAGDFQGWLRALTDCLQAEVRIEPMLTETLALIVEGLAEALRTDRPVRFEADPCEYTEHFGRMLVELTESEYIPRLAEGPDYRTLPLLSRALLGAGRSALSEMRAGEAL